MRAEPLRKWQVRGRNIPLDSTPLFMGIVNLTPDSFSEKPLFVRMDSKTHQGFDIDAGRAVRHALSLVRQGARILDLGAESTSPGSEPISDEEQLRRLLPTLRLLVRATDCPISIDTTSSSVAKAALEVGACIVNDISGGMFDPDMLDVVRHYRAGICLGHIQGFPATMQNEPQYDDVVAEVASALLARREAFVRAGVPGASIALDPGIGFGKTTEHNLAILRRVKEFRCDDSLLLIGHSRKRFLRDFCSVSEPSIARLDFMTSCVSVRLADKGVDVLRVHRVDLNRDAVLFAREFLS